MAADSGRAAVAPAPAAVVRVDFARWLWSRYLRFALLPVLLVELAFLGAYWFSIGFTYRHDMLAADLASHRDFARMAEREAAVIDARLTSLAALAGILASQTSQALQTPYRPDAAERARYRHDADGSFYTVADNGGAAAYFSGVVPVGPEQIDKVWRSVPLDALLKAVTAADDFAVQAYINTFDSYNRIYPYRDVLATYGRKMDIPGFNFYYEADAAHNPERAAVWTDAHLDPAGAGWLTSVLAPVYAGAKLEAVVGIDVALRSLIAQVLDLQLPWDGYGVLIGRDGGLIALSPRGEAHWGLAVNTQAEYRQAITQDRFRPDALNIGKRADTQRLADAIARQPTGTIDDYPLGGVKLHTAWSRIRGPGWTLVLMAPEPSIRASAEALNARLRSLGYWMITLLLAFYLLFVAWLMHRARRLSRSFAEPVRQLCAAASDIGRGHFAQALPSFEVSELQGLGEELVAMASWLGRSHEALTQAEARLRETLLQQQRLNQAQRRFIGIVSHEFRNPLAIIDSTAQSLARRADRLDAAAIGEKAEALREAVRRLIDVTDGALSFSQADTAQARGRPSSIDTAQLLSDLLRSFGERHRARAADLSLDPSTLPATLSCDPVMLRLILSDLLERALSRSSPGSALQIGGRELNQTAELWVDCCAASLDGAEPEPLPMDATTAAGGNSLRLAQVYAERFGGELSQTRTASGRVRITLRLPRRSSPSPSPSLPSRESES